jgi:hypothetical protein
LTRNITASFRYIAESNFVDDVDLVFLTISHPLLLEPIRVVLDDKDFIFGGETYTGFPFDIEILSDDEKPPTARLAIQNVDSRIGEAIRSLITPPRLKIQLLSSSDFDLSLDPREEWGGGSPGATAVYTADKLFLTNVQVDVLTVAGNIEGWDYLQRVWPGVRAQQDIFPGLFR